MILRSYPDYKKPGFDVSSPFGKHGWPNLIIHNKTNNAYLPLHAGPLTVKFTLKGEEYFATKQRSFRVSPEAYLIFNNGQKYSARIQSETIVETISVFFRLQFAEEVLNSLICSDDNILDDTDNSSGQPVTFMEMLYPQDVKLMPYVYKFRMASKAGFDDEDWLEEEFYNLLRCLLEINRKVGQEIYKIPAVKKSTRLEVYKKINIGKEFIDDNYCKDIKIDDAAKHACISPFHFLRLFKVIFEETPYQYITRKRIERAFDLILRTEMPITEVCFDVGFSSLSSFSWLLKQKYGMSPETMRDSYNSFQKKLAGFKK